MLVELYLLHDTYNLNELPPNMDSIPTVDLSRIISSEISDNYMQNNAEWTEIGHKFGDALHQVGFVYILNHQIDSNKIEKAFEESKTFFEQPLQDKMKYKLENATKGYHGGYVQNNSDKIRSSSITDDGLQDIFELRESYDFTGKSCLKLQNSTDFHSSLVALQNECKKIVKILFKLLAIALELDDTDFFNKCSRWIDDPETPSFKTFRSLYYPAIPQSVSIPQGKARVKEHSDFGFLTLLFQDSIGGLEVKTADGNWIPASPVPESILVNIGDMLEQWTGGYYPATKHRVLIPESENKKRTPRQSIVYFVHPDSNVLMKPLPSERLPKNYSFKSIKAYEFAKLKLSGVKSY